MSHPHSVEFGNVASALKKTADYLEVVGHDRRLPPAERHLYLRYAPFARELASRRRFCQELAAVDVTDDTPVDEAFRRIWPLLNACRFPNRPPYHRDHWAQLLCFARLGLFVLDFWRHPVLGSPLPEHVEVQFVYDGTVRQVQDLGDRLPIVRAVRIWLRPGRTKKQVREELARNLQRPLARFRKQVSPLVKEAARPGFAVRLLTFAPQPSRREPCPDDSNTVRVYLPRTLWKASVASNFTVRLSRGQRLTKLLDEIVDNVWPVVERVASITPAQGRPPDARDDARWWAMTALDGLTIEDVARRVSHDHPDAADLEETIARTLRRLGTKARTK